VAGPRHEGQIVTQAKEHTPEHGAARVAGLVYLVVVVTGMFSLAYAPSRLFAGADPAAITADVGANVQLSRLSIASELVCYTAFLLLPLALYRLLAPVGRGAAVLMVALAAASVPITFSNLTHHLDILRLVADGAAEPERLARISRALDGYDDGLFVVQMFWGLWLVPLGYLVFRSGFLPRLLGILLILAGVGYVVSLFGRLLFEGYAESGIAAYLRAPRIGEILICFWLLAFGARRSLFTRRSES
jgi:Domain of unknown function (DUF4386)